MRIQHLIYRVELPCATEEEKAQVEELKVVLGRILLYERTPCPFRRGFTVDLPEEPEEMIMPPRRTTIGPMTRAKKWEMKDIWRREGEEYSPVVSETNSPEDTEEEEEVVRKENEQPIHTLEPEVKLTAAESDHTKPPIRPREMTTRSVTAPPQLPMLVEEEEEALDLAEVVDTELEIPVDRSRASSFRSFYTSWEHAAYPPSPASEYADPIDTIPLYTHIVEKASTTGSSHVRDTSEITITSLPSVPSVDKAKANFPTPIAAIRPTTIFTDTDFTSNDLRTPTSPTSAATYRTLDARPRTSTISSNTSSTHSSAYGTRSRRTRREITGGLVSRTAALLLGPPSGLVSVMMQIASRIANTALSNANPGSGGAAYRYNLQDLPGRWEDSEEEREEEDFQDGTGESYALRRLNRDDAGGFLGGISDDDLEDLEEDDDDDYGDEEHDLSIEGETSIALSPAEEDDFGVPLGNDTPAKKGRKNWGWVRSPKSSPRNARTTPSKQTTRQDNDSPRMSAKDEEADIAAASRPPPKAD